MRYHRCHVRGDRQRRAGIAGSSGIPITSGVQGCGYGGKRGQKPRESEGEEVARWPD